MAHDSVKLYTAIYVALLAAATLNFLLFESAFVEFTYAQAVGGTLLIATVKTLLIVAYFQHLRWENRSLTYLMGLALALTMLLMAAATYSIS
ncbi:cytochrome C oxidase subunit IV family protein [Halorubrum sp. 2020YC2]|uniref:cytochrome C oxidase subunit IV family protein n=1 Tax=Halorubrum sp. 2020YC2 TaxID=2836432 RepID=UPI001BE99523|nr:cytochrome C oxidase subunit IV family protein [Halorubrum sp. 2020YC2]QWC20051.1 cytochrome C oxidase subunit IV family protein [Halorubrum sp. 2020YC2]